MKVSKLVLFAFATLAVVAGLAFSNPVLAGCGNKSKKMAMNRTNDTQDMQMSDDMPMCCKMRGSHKGEAQDKGEGSMSEHPMPGMNDQTQSAGQNKQVKDPVCSMNVDPKTAEKSVYKAQTYYFCSKEDKEAFEKSPGKYVKPGQKKTRIP